MISVPNTVFPIMCKYLNHEIFDHEDFQEFNYYVVISFYNIKTVRVFITLSVTPLPPQRLSPSWNPLIT